MLSLLEETLKILEACKWSGLAEPTPQDIFPYTFKLAHFYQQIYVAWIKFFLSQINSFLKKLNRQSKWNLFLSADDLSTKVYDWNVLESEFQAPINHFK